MKICKTIILLLIILLVSGCVFIGMVRIEGDSQHWKGEITYKISDTVENGEGYIEYLGDEQLVSIEYVIKFPEIFTIGHSGSMENINQDDTIFSIGILNPPHEDVDTFRNNVDDISITVKWETVSGNVFEENIDLEQK
ncbi:hypothetical protein [Ornithinibacillus xuwenensis]|uniref:Lipoprotein n=1 Tax=Ornithinibacillus xuwenensis TaxID=3144668 RepID=A0ABU9XDD5_9BACI